MTSDAADLPISRKKEIAGELVKIHEGVFRFIAGANGVDLDEKILLIRSLTPVYGVAPMIFAGYAFDSFLVQQYLNGDG